VKTVSMIVGKILTVVMASLLVVGSLASGNAQAQSGLVLSTPYPGLEVRPGEAVEFPLEVLNTGIASQPVNITVVSAPKGWQWALEGRGKTVHQVFAQRGVPQQLNLKVEIPAETKEGNHQVVVRASAAGVSSNLTLDLKVNTQTKQEGQLKAQYPQLEGPAGATFKFRVDLTNDTAKEQSYSLGAQAPPGWQVSFSPAYDSKKIASLSIKSGENQGLDVEIIPAQNVTAGKYTIPVSAVYAGGALQAELTITITGTYNLKLTTSTGRLNANAYPGQEREVTLQVENAGSGDLKGITFSSWEPTNWSVRFEPAEIDVLPAGETKQVKAYIKPDRRSIAGDYVVSLTASAAEARGSVEMRVLVKTSTMWGIVAILIIVAVISAVYRLFKLYGRR
jgi:uncharacterized membrane protein